MDNSRNTGSQQGGTPYSGDDQQTQKPVAYDVNGNPLYAAPPSQVPVDSNPTYPQQVVHVARAAEPIPVEVSDETRRRHEESMKHYPNLNLSEHEYVITAVRRHPIGMIAPLLATSVSVALMFIFMFNYPFFSEIAGLPPESFSWVVLIAIMFTLLFLIGGYIAIWVYLSNRFFLTNESVIQEIQMSIFSRKEQTVSLANIEDASFGQHGPIQTLLNYGSIRLSTEGDETTYRFEYVSNPKRHIAILNNAVEAFKNGRPVETIENENN